MWTKPKARHSFWRRDETGTSAIEFALMTPFLVVLLGGVVEFGFAMYEEMQVNAAVEAGILYAAANGWNSAAGRLFGYSAAECLDP